MPNLLKVKRGLKDSLPTLAAGELGWCTDTFELYAGDGSVNRLVGGGLVSDEAYNAATWDAVTDVAPSKNAVRDKVVDIEASVVAWAFYGG